MYLKYGFFENCSWVTQLFSSFQNMMSVPQISTTVMKTLCALTLSGGTTVSASLATLGMERYAKVGSICGHCSAPHIEPASPFSRPSASLVCTSWTLSCLSTPECCYMSHHLRLSSCHLPWSLQQLWSHKIWQWFCFNLLWQLQQFA